MEMQQTRHRFDADTEEQATAPQARAAKPFAGGGASRMGGERRAASDWFGPRTMLGLVAFVGIMTVVHIWQTTYGDLYHPPLTEPFYNKTMVEFSTKFGALWQNARAVGSLVGVSAWCIYCCCLLCAGTFTVDLYPEHAPQSVDAFKKLVDQGFYEKDAGFYRNEPNFVLQGGGFLAGKKSPFANLPVEYRCVVWVCGASFCFACG